MKRHPHEGNLLLYFHRNIFISPLFRVFVVMLGISFMVIFQLIRCFLPALLPSHTSTPAEWRYRAFVCLTHWLALGGGQVASPF